MSRALVALFHRRSRDIGHGENAHTVVLGPRGSDREPSGFFWFSVPGERVLGESDEYRLSASMISGSSCPENTDTGRRLEAMRPKTGRRSADLLETSLFRVFATHPFKSALVQLDGILQAKFLLDVFHCPYDRLNAC